MEPFKPKPKRGPEAIIQDEIMKALKLRNWLVRHLHGNAYQSGFPDLFCVHKKYGIRLVEIKNPKAYCFTPAQREFFPMLAAFGCGIWILVSAEEHELEKLMRPPNWVSYWH